MKKLITEEYVEENVLSILQSLDYNIIRGSNEEYLPGGSSALRSDYKDVVLIDKLRYALRKMKEKLNLYYDEEGDFLEINLGDFAEGYFKNLGGGLFERIDKKSNRITGMTIMGFKQRTKKLGEVAIPLPWEVEIGALKK